MANLNIKFNNKSYSIGPASLADALATLEAHLASMAEERLEGDGAEYYTLAPTALSFRSTAPLNELQEVQINGVTVDPSNYTLEEGSTIVTFPIEYLKTLNVGNYEVTVASDSKTAKGGFTVVAPELNEYGFYYNQPYTAYVDAWSTKTVFFMRENGTADVLMLAYDSIETCTYTISGNTITLTAQAGTFTATVNDGEIYCNEVATAFVLCDESIVADEDYIYIYYGGYDIYVVTPIDKMKSSYSPIKTGINGKSTYTTSSTETFAFNSNLTTTPVAPYNFIYGEGDFRNCVNLERVCFPDGTTYIPASLFEGCVSLKSVTIPVHIAEIRNYVFWKCTNLTDIRFEGTIEQWNAMTLGETWNLDTPATHVHCSDGDVAL